MQLQESEINLRPGVCVWMRPGRRYEAKQDPQDRLCVNFNHFDLLGVDGLPIREHDRLPPEVYDLYDVHYFDTVMRRINELRDREIDRENARSVATQLLRVVLMDMETVLARPSAAIQAGTQLMHYRMVTDLVAEMRESPHSIPTVAAMAERLDYSPDHFARVFKIVTGQTPQNFAISVRLNRACQLLLESDLGIGQIADVLGYEHGYHFTRQFSAKMGVSPSRYRRHGRDVDRSS